MRGNEMALEAKYEVDGRVEGLRSHLTGSIE
jgi:hypothetical protein